MIDLWSHFHGDTAMRSQLARSIAENDALRDEVALLRSRLSMLAQALELCRSAADAGLVHSSNDRVGTTEDGDEARRG